MSSIALRVERDRVAGVAVEKALPGGGMVANLPMVPFPEGGFQGFEEYDHLRLYLHTWRARFSFGGISGRRENLWQCYKGWQPGDLERFGFGMIALDTRWGTSSPPGFLRVSDWELVRLQAWTNAMEPPVPEVVFHRITN